MIRVFHSKRFWFIAIPLVFIGLLVPNLPKILNAIGLNRPYPGRSFQLGGKRALVVTTSQAVLGATGKPTGVYASEMSVPYYQFLDGGMQVDIASIAGGVIPIEPDSLRWPLITPEDQRFLADPQAQNWVKNSLQVDAIDFTQYDLVYLAGGWGAAYDLGQSEVLGRKISQAYAANAVLGSVCHGALGFLRATDPAGVPFVRGRHMTAVTDKQIQELGIEITPLHPERELRKAGALYESETAFKDIFASHVVTDGQLVTGQNQNDGAQVAQRMLAILETRTGK
jgi:putative intracellular protease/amidase